MASLFNPIQDEEDKNQSQGGGQLITSGTSATINPSTPSTPPAGGVGTGQPTSSGRFVNLAKYLKANEGTSGQMASKIGQHAETEATKAGEELNKAFGQFGQKVDSSTKRVDEGLKQNLSSFNINDDVMNRARDAYSQGYQGPQVTDWVKDSAGAKQQIDRADQLIKSTADYSGRKALLGEVYGKDNPRYAGGLQALDSALVSRDDEAKSNFDALRNKYSGLANAIGLKTNDVQSRINQAEAVSKAVQQQYGQAIQQGMDKQMVELGAKADAANRQRSMAFSQAKTLASRALSPIDKARFYQEGRKAEVGDVVDANTEAKLNALAAIIGANSPIVKNQQPLGSAYTFQNDKYEQALEADRIAKEPARRAAEEERSLAQQQGQADKDADKTRDMMNPKKIVGGWGEKTKNEAKKLDPSKWG